MSNTKYSKDFQAAFKYSKESKAAFRENWSHYFLGDPYEDDQEELTGEDYDLSDPNEGEIITQLRHMKRDARKYDKINVEELENIYRNVTTVEEEIELEKKYPWLSLVEIDDRTREKIVKTNK